MRIALISAHIGMLNIVAYEFLQLHDYTSYWIYLKMNRMVTSYALLWEDDSSLWLYRYQYIANGTLPCITPGCPPGSQ